MMITMQNNILILTFLKCIFSRMHQKSGNDDNENKDWEGHGKYIKEEM